MTTLEYLACTFYIKKYPRRWLSSPQVNSNPGSQKNTQTLFGGKHLCKLPGFPIFENNTGSQSIPLGNTRGNKQSQLKARTNNGFTTSGTSKRGLSYNKI